MLGPSLNTPGMAVKGQSSTIIEWSQDVHLEGSTLHAGEKCVE